MIDLLLHSGSGVPGLVFVGCFAGVLILALLLADKFTKDKEE